MFEVMAFDARTLSWWYDQKDNIDLEPPYQRLGQLWSERDREFLIDSILNGYDVPKIYIADFTFGLTKLHSTNKQYSVIDGKQRLGAIFEFFENKLRLAEDFEWTQSPGLSLSRLSYRDLLQNFPKAASKFANFNLSVMRVITDDEAKINELFVRLNRSKPLSGAELRNAMGGVVPDLIRSICNHVFFTDRIRFTTKRRQDQNAAAKLLLVEFRGRPVGTQKPGIDRFVKEGILAEVGTDEFKRAAERVNAVLNRMASIFVTRDPLLASAGPLPVYYWLVRESAPSLDVVVRPFLLSFEETRRVNRTLVEPGMPQFDSELALYDRLDRSTNNQGSIEGRFEILRKRLVTFVP
jgi:hypothetical protein